jgi:thioredoxin-dependent adenylylsulfate APS reductase
VIAAAPGWAGEAEDLEGLEPEAVLAWAYRRFPRLALVASFQAEAIVLIDMACRVVERPAVVTLDTGRLPEETHELIDRVRERYPIDLRVVSPDPGEVADMVGAHGQNLFRRSVELRERCCEVRKVRPLARALAGHDAWVTGLRRDQSSGRSRTPVVQADHAHGGIAKIAPLVRWTRERVWAYVEERGLERHPLYERGYRSIGCAPCTRAAGPDEDERAGRWWWEGSAVKECGLHWNGTALVRVTN